MRLRLLPILIVTAGFAFTARIGDLWQGLGTPAHAEPATETASPAADEPVGPNLGPNLGKVRGPDRPNDPLSMTDQEIDLLQALAERRQQLDRRARQIDQREVLLQAAERRIEDKVGGLKALQQAIENLLLQHEQQTEGQYQSLVKIYENMKPKDAARIFEELDMAVLLAVVERMKERKTAPILAKMNPLKAKAITIELAQRRELPAALQ